MQKYGCICSKPCCLSYEDPHVCQLPPAVLCLRTVQLCTDQFKFQALMPSDHPSTEEVHVLLGLGASVLVLDMQSEGIAAHCTGGVGVQEVSGCGPNSEDYLCGPVPASTLVMNDERGARQCFAAAMEICGHMGEHTCGHTPPLERLCIAVPTNFHACMHTHESLRSPTTSSRRASK